MTQPRYALYYAPPPGSALDRFGRDWLSSADRRPPPYAADPDLWARATESPAKYGFHATLKAPFRLADGTSESDLIEAAARFAAGRTAFDAPPLTLERLGRYLALVLSGPSPEMAALHEACVTEFEGFRAPLTAEDRQRRLASGLTERQAGYLETFGYPYIFEDFAFHMTLAGPADEAAIAALWPGLARAAAPLTVRQLQVGHICLFRQAGPADRFIIAERFDFRTA